jgi:hypothetical protein
VFQQKYDQLTLLYQGMPGKIEKALSNPGDRSSMNVLMLRFRELELLAESLIELHRLNPTPRTTAVVQFANEVLRFVKYERRRVQNASGARKATSRKSTSPAKRYMVSQQEEADLMKRFETLRTTVIAERKSAKGGRRRPKKIAK